MSSELTQVQKSILAFIVSILLFYFQYGIFMGALQAIEGAPGNLGPIYGVKMLLSLAVLILIIIDILLICRGSPKYLKILVIYLILFIAQLVYEVIMFLIFSIIS